MISEFYIRKMIIPNLMIKTEIKSLRTKNKKDADLLKTLLIPINLCKKLKMN